MRSKSEIKCVRNTWKDLDEDYRTPVVVFMQYNESQGGFKLVNSLLFDIKMAEKQSYY